MRISKRRALLNTLVIAVALGLAGGCKKEGKKTGKGKQAAGKAASGTKSGSSGGAAVGASGPLAGLKAPASVVAYGGTKSATAFFQKVSGVGSAVMPMVPPFATMIQMGLQKQLHLKTADVIDLNKPVRVAVIDPQKYGRNPAIFLLGTSGKDKFIGALTSKKKGSGENQFELDTKSGRKAYLNFVGDHVAVSFHKDLFAANKAFLGKLLGASIPAEVAMVMDFSHIHTLYGSVVDARLDMIDRQMKSNPMMAQQAKGLSNIIPGIKKLFKGADKMVLKLAFPAGGAKVLADFHPKKGSTLASGMSKLKPIKNGCYDRVEAGSPLVIAMNVDAAAAGDLIESMMALSFSMMPTDEAAKKKVSELMKSAWKQMHGDVVMVAPDLGPKELALAGLYRVKDGAALGKTMVEMMKFMYSSPKFIENYKKAGMEVSFKADAYKIGSTPVTVSAIKMTGGKLAANPFGKMISGFMTTHIAAQKDAAYFGYGPAAKQALEKLMSGKVQKPLSGDAGFKRALANAANGTLFLLYVSPSGIAKRVAAAQGGPSAMPDVPGGITFSFGMQGGVATMAFDVPKEQLKAIKALSKLAGNMMRSRSDKAE
jgi:hypothetical protein